MRFIIDVAAIGTILFLIMTATVDYLGIHYDGAWYELILRFVAFFAVGWTAATIARAVHREY